MDLWPWLDPITPIISSIIRSTIHTHTIRNNYLYRHLMVSTHSLCLTLLFIHRSGLPWDY
jgi:hypothetical protein